MKNLSLPLGAVTAAPCAVDAPDLQVPAEAPAFGGTRAAIPVNQPESLAKLEESKQMHVAYFGAAPPGSFAQAAWQGIEGCARAHNATAELFQCAFDAQKQASQIHFKRTTETVAKVEGEYNE